MDGWHGGWLRLHLQVIQASFLQLSFLTSTCYLEPGGGEHDGGCATSACSEPPLCRCF